MEKRVGFVGIIIEDRKTVAGKVNKVLSDFGDLICGRIGLPYDKRNCWVIVIIVDATTDEMGRLTGRLGMIPGVSVKSALSRRRGSVGKAEEK